MINEFENFAGFRSLCAEALSRSHRPMCGSRAGRERFRSGADGCCRRPRAVSQPRQTRALHVSQDVGLPHR